MLMLAPPRHELIEYCNHFIAYCGGSESNTAIGLERLGIHTGWIGKLPRNALGYKIFNEIRSQGVDTNGVIFTDKHRAGIFFFEWGTHPRPHKTIYDRSNSAASTLTYADIDWEYLSHTKWLHFTGITPALSKNCRNSVIKIIENAHSKGIRISFDLNYRRLLWDEVTARITFLKMLPYINILIATQKDIELILNKQMEAKDALKLLFEKNPCESIVMTLGKNGSIAFDGNKFFTSPGYDLEPVSRLGAGDAFDAGFLYGYITHSIQTGLDYGMAMAALKMTIPQNIPLINRIDVQNLMSGKNIGLLR